MQIKDFADKYQMQADTIRYYEKQNLLKPKRRENGYREYDEECEKQLQLIVVLKQLGFTIKEIQQLLILKGKAISAECNLSTTSLLEQKVSDIEEKIQFYQHALKVLQTIKELIEGEKYAENKAIIEELIVAFFESMQKRGIS
ncbi:MerR family transcriptional regulator [Shouchella clausii]|uniref:MerR family transcriptional regulator n=1 Tax=Shouchella TaxID=2893057 RepID=UPI0004E6790B|nr:MULTISPECIES: MerR family transcriptional regulator [Shouchella]ALA53580.1 Transcriptional regulator, MerR family [Shouchella clausii]KKI86151.1 MarR family transcriptional regulator [Shouchella clausii]MBU3229842.1 MerR family transcriptional regulator [Shouchella clausii]MBU3264074.1 MerR family transcriptional regulator [Shouchella clausii]MBU3506743.1 MerR family transcriptional regulator [Shouchella clausii]